MTFLPKAPGGFRVVLADPPWAMKRWSAKGDLGRPQHYKRMSLEDIKNMPVKEVAAKDSWLFLWTTGPHLRQAFDVIDAWGFKYSGMGFVWVKLNKNSTTLFFSENDIFMGGGYTTRKNAEFCLLARKGAPRRLSAGVHEIIVSPRREHSRKPDHVHDRIASFSEGPYLELFARRTREGWAAFGDEKEKFNDT